MLECGICHAAEVQSVRLAPVIFAPRHLVRVVVENWPLIR